MPLTMAREGEVTSIKRVGGKEEVRRHLENMGFVPGTDVTVVTVNNGNVIVNVKGSPGCNQQGNGQQNHDIAVIMI